MWNNFNRIKLLMELFQNGREISNKENWKRGQAFLQPIIFATLVAGVNLLQACGISIPIDNDVLLSVAGVLFFVINTALTIVTTKHLGVGAKAHVQDDLPAMYGVPEGPTALLETVQEVAVEAAREVIPVQAVDTLSAANEWLKRNARK